jgi:hypothetical protein
MIGNLITELDSNILALFMISINFLCNHHHKLLNLCLVEQESVLQVIDSCPQSCVVMQIAMHVVGSVQST